MAVSLLCQLSIRGAAVLEYGSKGSGVLKDGSGGSCGESAGGFGGLVPQAVRNSAVDILIVFICQRNQ